MDPEAFDDFIRRRDKTGDDARPMAVAKRHDNGSRTARENLEDLVQGAAFDEYGQFAVAAQRSRRSPEDLQEQTCLLYTSPSPRDLSTSRMPSSA